MSTRTYNIETCITNDQINIVFTGGFRKPAAAYLEDQLKHACDDRHAEVILNMKDLKHITGQCLQVVHSVLTKIYLTKKIVIICRNDSQIESLLLHLGFAQWFSFFNDEAQLTNADSTGTDTGIEAEDTTTNNNDETALLESAA